MENTRVGLAAKSAGLGMALLLASAAVASAPVIPQSADSAAASCRRCVVANMEYLASDALRGRGSTTHDELVAATYLAAQMREYGLKPVAQGLNRPGHNPAGNARENPYIQVVELTDRRFAEAPAFTVTPPDSKSPSLRWRHGKQVIVARLSEPKVAGPLQVIDLSVRAPEQQQPEPKPGAVVLLIPSSDRDAARTRETFSMVRAGAAAVLVPISKGSEDRWRDYGKELPKLAPLLDGKPVMSLTGGANIIGLTPTAFATVRNLPEGSRVEIEGRLQESKGPQTWNVVAAIPGSAGDKEVVLISAHFDHVGVGKAVNGDEIYNGANDDASGSVAVLELARIYSRRPQPRRTILFALFGAEEKGGWGSTYFREHPPVPLGNIVANVQFEMLGQPEPKLPAGTLAVTGFDLSDLAEKLMEHGARLGPDPYPDQKFFQRSDNYSLAKRGVVAHTFAGGLMEENYHRPSDEVGRIDFDNMLAAINSMVEPIWWLVNSDFVPQWKDGKKP